MDQVASEQTKLNIEVLKTKKKPSAELKLQLSTEWTRDEIETKLFNKLGNICRGESTDGEICLSFTGTYQSYSRNGNQSAQQIHAG
jgi:hypothetical protein